MDSTDLEPITDDNWTEAASVLCRSAMFYETLLTESLQLLLRDGKKEEVEELLASHGEEIEVHQAAVQNWRRFLEIADA